MVVENDLTKRALLLLPVVLFFTASKVLYAIDAANTTGEILEKNRKRMS
jgi:hypothetical protein